MIVNGRISDRAFPRYRRWRWFFEDVLQRPDAILTQSDQDAARYLELGAPRHAVQAIGNLKHDAEPSRAEPPSVITDLIAKLHSTAIWIAASTMPGADREDVDEDDAVINAFQKLAPSRPGLLLILVPRKPERFDTAAMKLRDAGVRYVHQSQTVDPDLNLPCVVLLDSIGELASLFPIADVVFMGGTLARRGGHNLLEPGACRKAIVTGPHLENLNAIAAEFREQRAFLEIGGANELAAAVARLIDDPRLREDLGDRALALAAGQRGATEKAVSEIFRCQECGCPVLEPVEPGAILALAARSDLGRGELLFAATQNSALTASGHASRQHRGHQHGRGGKNSPGGSLGRATARGRAVPSAILTRGYRRRSIETTILVEAGKGGAISVTGDEAQIFVQSGYAHSGIGADRFETGRLLEEKYRPDIFLLDDGFQHTRLRRDLDLVVIDALIPSEAARYSRWEICASR